MAKFPTVAALAQASDEEVNAVWAGTFGQTDVCIYIYVCMFCGFCGCVGEGRWGVVCGDSTNPRRRPQIKPNTKQPTHKKITGLGYYRRARMLQQGARALLAEHGGELPATVEALLTIPGV